MLWGEGPGTWLRYLVVSLPHNLIMVSNRSRFSGVRSQRRFRGSVRPYRSQNANRFGSRMLGRNHYRSRVWPRLNMSGAFGTHQRRSRAFRATIASGRARRTFRPARRRVARSFASRGFGRRLPPGVGRNIASYL